MFHLHLPESFPGQNSFGQTNGIELGPSSTHLSVLCSPLKTISPGKKPWEQAPPQLTSK